jgi:hypothetical protein
MMFDTQEVLASLQRLMDQQDEYIKEWLAKIARPWWRRIGERWLEEAALDSCQRALRKYCELHHFYSRALHTNVDLDFETARELGLVKCE